MKRFGVKTNHVGGLKAGNSASYMTIEVDGAMKPTGAASAAFGGTTNKTNFSNAGLQSMSGTARVYKEIWIPASEWDANSGSPANLTTGCTYSAIGGAYFHTRTLTPTADNAEAITDYCLIAPLDAATTGSVIPYMEIMPTTAIAAGSDMTKPVIHWVTLNSGGASAATAGSVALAVSTCVNPGTVGARQTLTFPAMPSFTAGQMMKLYITFPAAGASTNSASYLGLAGLRLKYVADRIGASGVS